MVTNDINKSSGAPYTDIFVLIFSPLTWSHMGCRHQFWIQIKKKKKTGLGFPWVAVHDSRAPKSDPIQTVGIEPTERKILLGKE